MTLLIAVMIATGAVTISWLTLQPKTNHATYLMCFLTGGIAPSILFHQDEWGIGWTGALLWIAYLAFLYLDWIKDWARNENRRGGPPLE
jgi:hypothetical protein